MNRINLIRPADIGMHIDVPLTSIRDVRSRPSIGSLTATWDVRLTLDDGRRDFLTAFDAEVDVWMLRDAIETAEMVAGER